MKTIIAGSRNFTDLEIVSTAFANAFDRFNKMRNAYNEATQTLVAAGMYDTAPEFIERAYFCTEIVSGCARGVDRLGEQLAEKCGIAVKRFPADWDRFGKSAGIKRNLQMAEYADCLIAIWVDNSPGTKHMIEAMEKLSKHVFVVKLKTVSSTDGKLTYEQV